MLLGEVRVANESDFKKLVELAADHGPDSKWELAAKRRLCTVYTQSNSLSSFKMIKIVAEVSDVAALTVYDCLHDSKFRPVWDKNLAESREICVIDPQNDIGYYQVKTPKPLKRRDFVTQRSWMHSGDTYMILNHSVFHKAEPPRKNVIRGKSFYTGYVIKSTGNKSCTLTYISQADPGGNIPAWLMNRLITVVAPKITEKMTRAAAKYESWKAKNRPEHKPWRWPDQIDAEFIDWDDVVGEEDQRAAAAAVEENLSALTEGDVEVDDEGEAAGADLA